MPPLPQDSLDLLSWRCPNEIAERSPAVWLARATPRAGHYLFLSWIPQAGAPGRRHAGILRGTWPPGIFRLRRGRAGGVWRPYVDTGAIYAACCPAASCRNGRGDLESAWQQRV